MRRALVLALSIVLGAALAASAAWGATSSDPAPSWRDRPLLSYLLLQDGVEDALRREVGLSPNQIDAVLQLARDEAAELKELQRANNQAVTQADVPVHEREAKVSQFNVSVRSLVSGSLSAAEGLMTPEQKARFERWLELRWQHERALYGNGQYNRNLSARSMVGEGSGQTLRVLATWFYPWETDAFLVALPDKYIKFANLGWQHEPGYEGSDYRVRLEYKGTVVDNVPVLDSGPWNIDDTYWSAGAGDPQPRRLFGDLPQGMPEAQAAFYDGYNGGLDQYGRQVTLPCAIDLSPAVSRTLGFRPNDWINVTFLWRQGGTFELSTGSVAAMLQAGQSRALDVTVTPRDGFGADVSLSASAPSGVTASLSSTVVQPGASSRLTVSTSGGLASGAYLVTVTGSGGGITKTHVVTVYVVGHLNLLRVPRLNRWEY